VGIITLEDVIEELMQVRADTGPCADTAQLHTSVLDASSVLLLVQQATCTHMLHTRSGPCELVVSPNRCRRWRQV